MMQKFINLCNDNQGFIMIVLTAIYVLATISIYRANRKSTKIMEKSLLASEDSASAMYDNIDLDQFIQNQNARIQLFNLRIEVYKKIEKILKEALSYDHVRISAVFITLSNIREDIYFLFGDDISSYYVELENNISIIKQKLDDKTSDEFQESANWILSQIEGKNVRDVFNKYLNLKNYGALR